MIKWDELADIEVAALLYAFERFHDDTKSGWKKPIETLAGKIRNDALHEYTKRNLHWSQYQNE